MPEFFTINRDVLLARPTKAMIDWVNGLYPQEDSMPYSEQASHDDWDVFLIPDHDSPEDALEYVKKHCDEFLSIILDDWCMEEDRWPKPLNWALFERFIHYTVQTVVMDTVSPDEEE